MRYWGYWGCLLCFLLRFCSLGFIHGACKPPSVSTVLVVSQDGTGDFTSISQAVESIPLHNSQRVVINIKSGLYREKIVIPKSKCCITLQGEGSSTTVIVYNATAASFHNSYKNGTVPLQTFNSATVAVNSRCFVANDLSFQNTASPGRPGEVGKQAVALRISGDMAAFHNCSFYGSQDTLYDHKGRHYFKSCYIEGTVDFVFGYGRSFYKECTLNSISNYTGCLTAQKRTNSTSNSGFSFVDCNITGSGRVYLGRAWGDHSRVVFSNTYMEALVLPQGWENWKDSARNRTVFYGEYNCTGPGSNNNNDRVPWARNLSYAEAEPFLTESFIQGESWIPAT